MGALLMLLIIGLFHLLALPQKSDVGLGDSQYRPR
jgi:hypothetical protein